MGKQPVSAQPLLSNSARGQKGATAVADAVESPRTANFDLWEDAPPEKDAQCCGVSRRCGVALVAALSVAAVGGFFLFSHRTRPITEGLIGCGTKEQCLTIIDNYYLNAKRQKYAGNGAGMVQTYGPGSIGGGPCGDEHCKLVEPCPNFAQRNPGDGTPHCRFDVYDNALTAIYLAKRGKLQESRQVLDAFIGLLYPTGNVTPGLDYGAGYLLPSRRSLTLLAAGYTDKSAEAGVYEGMGVADGAVDTGNNAWVGMAFAHYAAATADPCYSLVAHDMLAALVKSTQCTDEMQGFGSRLTPFPQNYRSTEHNTDMFALAHMLGAAGAAAEKQAGAFVRSMWEQLPDSKFSKYGSSSYAVGTANNYPCDTVVPEGPAAVDAQFWNLLADADPVPERKAASMAFAMQEQDPALTKTTPAEPKGLWARDTDLIGNGTTGVGRGAVLHGVRFTSGGNGIQWENTASACMAMCRFRALYGDQTSAGDLRPKIQAATDSIKHLLAVYGVVPASVLGGNIAAYQVNDFSAEYPGGSDTGIGWTYLRYPHAASTAWAGLLLLYQFDEDDEIDENANPFAPPANPVPNPQQSPPRGAPGWAAAQKYRQCLPITEVPEPATGGKATTEPSCSANPGCAHLVGECCPTVEGMLLACCSDDNAPPAPPPAPPYPPPDHKNIFGRDERDAALAGSGGEDAPHGTEPGGKGGGGGKGESYPGAQRGDHGAPSSDRCEANRGCAVLGLTGWCCPTLEGTQLGCC